MKAFKINMHINCHYNVYIRKGKMKWENKENHD